MKVTYNEPKVTPRLGSLLRGKKSDATYLIVFDRTDCDYKLLNLATSEVLMTGRKTVEELLKAFNTTVMDYTVYLPEQLHLKVGDSNNG